MTSQLLAFILYFMLVLGIGVFFMIKSKDGGDKDYFLGGRSMGPWVTAMSAQASDMSGWLLMGFPGSILAFGMGQVWIGIGLALGTIANWVFVAKRLRNFSKAAKCCATVWTHTQPIMGMANWKKANTPAMPVMRPLPMQGSLRPLARDTEKASMARPTPNSALLKKNIKFHMILYPLL